MCAPFLFFLVVIPCRSVHTLPLRCLWNVLTCGDVQGSTEKDWTMFPSRNSGAFSYPEFTARSCQSNRSLPLVPWGQGSGVAKPLHYSLGQSFLPFLQGHVCQCLPVAHCKGYKIGPSTCLGSPMAPNRAVSWAGVTYLRGRGWTA